MSYPWRTRFSEIGLWLILSALLLAGCTTPRLSSSDVPTAKHAKYAKSQRAEPPVSTFDQERIERGFISGEFAYFAVLRENKITYDSNGNLTSDGLRGFDYDDENRLTRITVTNNWKTELIYDGLGRRRMRNEYLWFTGAWALNNTLQYVYHGNVVVQERWGGDEPWVNYTRGLDLSGTWQGAGGIGGLLAWSQKISGAYQSHYYHADGNGNVTALINANQVISARYLYEPYGNLLASSGGMADVNAYRFSSQEFHDKSGLYLYASRPYEPRLGRWLNGDPLREGGGINLYSFCGGDPVNRIDAWGLADKWYDSVAEWSGRHIDRAKNYLYNSTPVWVGTAGATALDVVNMVPSFPAAIGHMWEGAGTFAGNPSWENAGGLAQDISFTITLAIPIAARVPAANVPIGELIKPAPAPVVKPPVVEATPAKSVTPVVVNVPGRMTYAEIRQQGYMYTDRMSNSQLRRLVDDIDANGLNDKVINYVKIDGDNFIVLGNNRLRAAKKLGIANQLIFEEVQLPFRGFKTTEEVIRAGAENVRGL